MANEAKFIGLENVQSVANKLSPNIVIGPAFYMKEELDRLGIKVETGVQYQLTKTVFAGKGGQTRRKEVGNVKESKLGYLFSRKLTANICVHRIRCNEDDFQEKPGNIAINGSAEMHFEKTELFMTEQASLFSQDVFNNIIGGDATSNDEEMNLFDGLLTVMATDINDATVSQEKKNLIPSGVFDAPQSEGDSDAFDEFLAWFNKWDARLKKQKVNVYMPTDIAQAISDAYEQKHRSHKSVTELDNGNFQIKSNGLQKLTFIPVDDIKGNLVFATIEGNLLLGVNNESDDSFVKVVPEPSQDVKDLVMQIQGIFGFMLVDPTARAFVTNGGAAEMTFNSGDYTKDAVYVTANADANGKAMGTVVIKNGSDTIVSGTEVAKGTTLTLTATGIAADATADPVVKGTTFVKWSTGSTENPLNVVATGDPMSITAIFRENA
jgi:hypothetical protein